MRRLLVIPCCLLFIATLSSAARALPAYTARVDHTPPSYDMKAQSLLAKKAGQK